MQKVRKGVFETNSSSTHSLSISDADYNYTTSEDSVVIDLAWYKFGWEQEKYFDFESKFAYVLLYLRDWVDEEFKKLHFPAVTSMVKEFLGVTELTIHNYFNNITGDWLDGYIDHQSVECRDLDYLFQDESGTIDLTYKTLKKLLFNGDSYVETDNDNH